MCRTLITGDRRWECHHIARTVVARLVARYGDDLTVVVGCASGADAAIRDACLQAGVTLDVHAADWKRLRRAAGPIRNSAMIATKPDFAIAVHRNLRWSLGTADCVKQCLRKQIPVYLIDGNEVRPARITADYFDAAETRSASGSE